MSLHFLTPPALGGSVQFSSRIMAAGRGNRESVSNTLVVTKDYCITGCANPIFCEVGLC